MPIEAALCERIGPVAVLRLNRPDKHNAVNGELSKAFVTHMDALSADDAVHAVIVTGAGDRAFCAGADMTEATLAREIGAPGDPMVDVVLSVARCPKPVIAAINGYAFGGGAVLAITCDIRIAAHTARFLFPRANYGLVVGGSQLPRLVGPARAKDLIFSARTVDSPEALRIGLVEEIVALPDLAERALEVAARIAENSTTAVRASKEVIDVAAAVGEAGRRELEANKRLRDSAEHKRRFRAAADRVAGRDG